MKDWCCVLFLSLKLDFCIPEDEYTRRFCPKAKKEDPTQNLEEKIGLFHNFTPLNPAHSIKCVKFQVAFQNIFTSLQTSPVMKENQFHDVLLSLKILF